MNKLFNFAFWFLVLIQVSFGQQQQSRVVGGSPSVIDYSPFLVQILNNGRIHCGGTLVTNQIVVTAAHCTKNTPKQSLLVKAGTTYVHEHGAVSRVYDVIQPSFFTMETMDFDVAVLKLVEPLVGPRIAPIGLCTRQIKVGDAVQLMGWGAKRDYTDQTSDQLFTGHTSVVDTNVCASMYGKLQITVNMFCAYAPGKSSCNGDSGGPVLINGEFCGIVSFGINCGVDNNNPAVYTNVLAAMDFIQQAIQKFS